MLSISDKSPPLYVSKNLLLKYLKPDTGLKSKCVSNIREVAHSLIVQKIDLELLGAGSDTESKTATVAINTDDDAWTVENEHSISNFHAYANSSRVHCFQLHCMKHFLFPLYGILEKAVQTDISIPPQNKNCGILKTSNDDKISPKKKNLLVAKKRKSNLGYIIGMCMALKKEEEDLEPETKLKKMLEEDLEMHNTKRLVINKILEDDMSGT